jgi:exopolysaccharide biosynthesis protein
MDKKPFRGKQSKGRKNGSGFRNVGFVAIIILFLLVIFAAYGQPSSLKEIPISQAVSQANNGQYAKVMVSGDELDITKKGDKSATLKAFTCRRRHSSTSHSRARAPRSRPSGWSIFCR